MTSPAGFPNLHDATLVSLHIDWADGLATIELEPSPRIIMKLEARGLREITLTRREEWGRSVSVNGAEMKTNDAGELTLQIEMQSGDTIELTAAHFGEVWP